MARKRKTISVDRLKEMANHYMMHSPDHHTANRAGNAVLLEAVLHETGNYNGFGYLNANDMKASDFGNTVGINTTPDKPAESLTYEEKFEGTDDTRRFYF